MTVLVVGDGCERTKVVGADVSSFDDPNQVPRAKRAAARTTEARLESSFDIVCNSPVCVDLLVHGPKVLKFYSYPPEHLRITYVLNRLFSLIYAETYPPAYKSLTGGCTTVSP